MFPPLCSSGASTSGSEIDHFMCYLQEESDDGDTFISFTTTESKCEAFFQRGLELKLDGELVQALACFKDCLGGMQKCQYFVKLPQTLQQLEYIYRAIGLDEKAEEYGRAEKLFQEATRLQPNKSSEGQTEPKTKRRPFSKKTRSLASINQGCNPGEYGNLMIKKADEYEKLAFFCVEKGEIELALDYCSKLMVLRQLMYGEVLSVTEASLNYFKVIYAELEAGKESIPPVKGNDKVVTNKVKGDLSTATDCSSTNGDVFVKGESICSTGEDTRAQCQVNSEMIKSLQTEPQRNETSVMTCRQHLECMDITESQKFHTFPGKNKADFYSHNGVGGTQECKVTSNGVSGHGTLGENHHNHVLNGNLCMGMTNLTKLSAELKAPMCVTLNIQPVGPGAGMEHPRCLPLWVLLLGAFVEMALLAYMLYYH